MKFSDDRYHSERSTYSIYVGPKGTRQYRNPLIKIRYLYSSFMNQLWATKLNTVMIKVAT